MPAPEGNQNGLKLKDAEVRLDAYKKYCEWIAKGKSKRSFKYRHERLDLCCTWETLEKYIKNNPVEFDPIQKKIAEAEAYTVWEQIAEDGAKGVDKQICPPILQMVMRNKFGWDKKDDEEESLVDNQYINSLKDLFAAMKGSSSKPSTEDTEPPQHPEE